MEESKQSKRKSRRSQKPDTKSKKKRKTKDPDAPKRPLGAYFYYFKANNSIIKSQNPELNQKNVVARIAGNWKTLTEEEKQPFVDMSKQDKERYVREKNVYDENKAKQAQEEEKFNKDWKQRRGKKASDKGVIDASGNFRPGYEQVFRVEEEREVRLADVLGEDQISFPSDSEMLAPYSPPASYDGNRSLFMEKNQEVKHEDNNDNHHLIGDGEDNIKEEYNDNQH